MISCNFGLLLGLLFVWFVWCVVCSVCFGFGSFEFCLKYFLLGGLVLWCADYEDLWFY